MELCLCEFACLILYYVRVIIMLAQVCTIAISPYLLHLVSPYTVLDHGQELHVVLVHN